LMTTRGFQPKNAQFMDKWYEGELNKKVFYLGPQAPVPSSPYKAPLNATDASNPFAPIFAFLDAQAPKSTILISFGTLFYPYDHAWRIETIVRTLLETKTPFILSRAARMFTPFSPEIEKALEEHRDAGLVADFVPQRQILGHPNLGAFLTHGGINSMNESIVADVPNIFWPFTGDQPLHAVYMTESLDCAFELLQVRTGLGARPPCRGGKVEGTPEAVAAEFKQILVDLKGKVGDCKRKNLHALNQQFLEALKHDAEAETNLRAFLKWAGAEEKGAGVN